jgi:hypothetical protein
VAKKTKQPPFFVKDCALAAISTGQRAQNLKELRERLLTIHPGAVHYHFWGGVLRPRFDDPEFNNDFASWARHALHDVRLAERLGIIDPADYRDIEALRQEIIEVIEERIDETEYLPWTRPDQQFHFIRAQTVVFDTHLRIQQPKDLPIVTPQLSVSSIYYHFIDARRRLPLGKDDFRAWLEVLEDGYRDLSNRLAEIDPYFINLVDLRRQLTAVFTEHLGSAI